MKYLNKYNEGIFSSKKVDKKLISDIKKYLEDNYQVINYNEDNDDFVFCFTSDGMNYRGEIKISDEYQQETGIKKITKVFSKPSIGFSLYHCDDLGNKIGSQPFCSRSRLIGVSMFDDSDYYETIIDSISSVVNSVRRDIEMKQKSQKEKEELKDKTISKDELEDVLVNLSDICDAEPGSNFEIKETFIRRTDGVYMYLIKFTKKDLGFNFKEIKSIIGSRSYGTPRINIDNLGNLKSIIEEIDNVKYALKEGWDLDVNIYIKENTIEMEVYEATKK
jgi:hypothetical protein